MRINDYKEGDTFKYRGEEYVKSKYSNFAYIRYEVYFFTNRLEIS